MADDLQVGDPAQIRQDLILHAISEIRVLLIVAQIFKWQNRDRLLLNSCSRLALSRRCVDGAITTEKKQSNRYNRADNYYINPGAFFMSSRCDLIDFFGALESFWR